MSEGTRKRDLSKRQGTKKNYVPSIKHSRRKDHIFKRTIHGGRFDPGTNPPNVTYQPWYPLTIVITATDTYTATADKILDEFRSQLDPQDHAFKRRPNNTPTDPFTAQFRIQSIRVWNMTGRTIGLAVDDYADTLADSDGRDQICGLIDTGTSLHIPAIGFELPSNLKQTVLRNDSKHKNVYLFDVTGKGSIMIYVSILWRLDGPINVPKFHTDFDILLSQNESIQRTSYATQDNTKRTADACETIVEHTKGSLTQTIIDGAAVVAPYVVPVAGMSCNHNTELLEKILAALNIDAVSSESSAEVVEIPFDD